MNQDKVKELLTLMGIPYYDANGEAETVCARLYQNNIILYTIKEVKVINININISE